MDRRIVMRAVAVGDARKLISEKSTPLRIGPDSGYHYTPAREGRKIPD
jgi:hypothetical protein